jgi:cell wall-associated NlpC family hydrolase
MKPFVKTEEDAERVIAAADSWKGTPYAADGAFKGSGCSCSLLPHSILTEAGMVIPVPPQRGKMRKVELLSVMEQWLTTHEGTHFIRMAPDAPHSLGDVMLFDAGYGHLGLCMGRGNVIHSIQRHGVREENYRDVKLADRIVGVWRPMISE